uniref:hypothetical protein n=1 Tax=Agathobacter sp. TaxID=2021311 RepID=UPI0040567D5A
MLGVLRDYCETVHPYREVTSLEVKKKEFAGISKMRIPRWLTIWRGLHKKIQTKKRWQETYVSNLENLREYNMVWAGFGLDNSKNENIYSNPGEEALWETWKDALQLTSLISENYCVCGKRDEIIAFLQDNTFDSILIENVNLW